MLHPRVGFRRVGRLLTTNLITFTTMTWVTASFSLFALPLPPNEGKLYATCTNYDRDRSRHNQLLCRLHGARTPPRHRQSSRLHNHPFHRGLQPIQTTRRPARQTTSHRQCCQHRLRRQTTHRTPLGKPSTKPNPRIRPLSTCSRRTRRYPNPTRTPNL